ncbi:MAG: hypothetical protein Q8P84_07675 [Deltaproteobacteria bacterium]|nr:hypothetical protein [Deltaproteobacteria bacterium]
MDSIEMIQVVAKSLQDLKEDVVFIGGATVALYFDEEVLFEVRPTDDVDCVIELTTRAQYYQLEEKLREKGFRNATNAGPLCRWKIRGITVDIMPTSPAILGFSNAWYTEGIEQARWIDLSNKEKIKIFSEPYFLATKIEAFKGRGGNDYRMSSDVEDIITILNGVPDIVDKILQAPSSVKKYLQKSFKEMLETQNFHESVYAHLPERQFKEEKKKLLVNKLEKLIVP